MDRDKNKRKRKIGNYKLLSYVICCTIFFIIIVIVIKSYIDGNIPLFPMVLILGFYILVLYLSLVGIYKFFKWKIKKDRKKELSKLRKNW